MTDERIPFDRGTDEGECAAANGGFECTLPNGHDGDHIAHGLYEQELARWPLTPPSVSPVSSGEAKE